MKYKDIASFRRHLKLDHDLLQIFDLLHVYVTKESHEIYHVECHPFAMLERDQQELYMGNFKKLLSGQLDEKLFELKFNGDGENHTQFILHQGLMAETTEGWTEQMLRVVEKMMGEAPFQQDTVITFIRGQYFKPTKRKNEESEVSERDEVYHLGFILCTVNKTEQPKKTLLFDYVSKQFKCNTALDPVIKLAPESGFLFPCFTSEGSVDVNHILYSTGKAHEPDVSFIEQVLNSEIAVTAKQDKAVFEEVVKEVVGEELDPHTLAQVYEQVHRHIEECEEEEEIPMLDSKDVEQVLVSSGVPNISTDKVDQALEHIVDDRKYELKASSVLPKFNAKSIKIDTKVATISIRPQDLKFIKQINHQGKRCLLIEVDEDIVIEGFPIRSESL